MSAAVDLAVDVTAAVTHRTKAFESRARGARAKIIAIARELAESGMSPEMIREAMSEGAREGADRAAAYIAEYDREEEDRRVAEDRADIDDEREARAEKHEAAQ